MPGQARSSRKKVKPGNDVERGSTPAVGRHEGAHRSAHHMIDPLVGWRFAKVEKQRLEHRRMAGVEELRRSQFSILDCEIACCDLVVEIAAQPRYTGGGPCLVESLPDCRHSLRNADHRPKR